MKKTFAYAISGLAGALALGLAATAPAQARPAAASPAVNVQADVVLVGQRGNHRNYGHQRPRGGHHAYRGRPYYGGWRQSNWHQRHYNQNRNYRYGPHYRHNNYGNVRPFATFIRILAGAGYHNFHRPVFHGQGRHWTPHYFVRAYDGYNRGVNLRVCAYTGNVLGWQYY